jgi:GntR family transcriptional regulator
MRKALDRLEANRLVTRLQGRGTFVEDHSKDAYASRFERFRDMGGGSLELESRILAQEPGEADPTEQARLELRSPQRVLRTTRVRLRGNKPFLYETAVLATSRFPALNGNPYGDYQLGAFAQRHGVLLGQAEEHLTLSEAGGDAVGLLDVEPGTILLRLDRIVRSLTGEPVEWRVGLCPLRDEQYVVSMN